MNVSIYLTLLFTCSLITGLVVEAEKRLMNEKGKKYSPNKLALITGFIIGCGVTLIYYVMDSVGFNTQNITAIFLMGFASALGAMFGYDKIIQTIQQISSK